MARKLKLSCYTTNYALREIAAVEFTLKMCFQKVRDELTYCFADGILDEEEFFLLYDAYKSTNPIYSFWEYDEFSLDPLSSDELKKTISLVSLTLSVFPNSLKRQRKRFRFTTQRLTSIFKLLSKFNNFA